MLGVEAALRLKLTMRRRSASLCGVFLASCALAISCVPAEPETRRLNVVLIVIDTLRAANLSLHGYARPTTPHIDHFAKQGVHFGNAISIGGNTTTAMAGIMTGHMPFFEFGTPWDDQMAFGMNRFYQSSDEQGLPKSLDSLAQRFQRAGYKTVGMVTNPYLKRIFNFHRGFDSYREIFNGISRGHGEQVSSSAIKFLESITTEPFFLYLHYMDVHGPYNPPDAYRNCFEVNGSIAGQNAENWRVWDDTTDTQQSDVQKLHQHMTELYDCSLRYLDDQVNRVLTTLRDRDLIDESVVVITSDHGEEFLEHGGTGHKGRLYGEILQVPLIIRVPGLPRAEVDAVVRNFDIMPTLMDLAGIEYESGELDAQSLVPLLQGKSEAAGRRVYANFPQMRTYRDSRYKLFENKRGRRKVYDLLNDPHELKPLGRKASNNPRIASLRAEFVARVKSLRDSGAESVPTRVEDPDSSANTLQSRSSDLKGVDEETRRQLRALGYTD
jgi:arylsulfatase A-like enzyme